MSNPYPKVRVRPETHAVLVRLAEEHGRPMTDILAAAVTIMLRHEREIHGALPEVAKQPHGPDGTFLKK